MEKMRKVKKIAVCLFIATITSFVPYRDSVFADSIRIDPVQSSLDNALGIFILLGIGSVISIIVCSTVLFSVHSSNKKEKVNEEGKILNEKDK